MANIISNTSSYEDLVRIINLLTSKINDLEKKINVLEENNYLISGYNMSNEVILEEHVFRSVPYVIPDLAPPVTRQNAFPMNF